VSELQFKVRDGGISVIDRALTITEYAVLGMLGDLGRPASGYDLRKAIEQSVGFIWRPSKTQLYAVLRMLVASGFLTQRVVEQRERPDKHLYRLTPSARTAVRDWLERDEGFADLDRASDVILLKTFFAGQGDKTALIRQLVALRDAYAARLAIYENIWRRRRRSAGDDFAGLTLRFGIMRAKGAIEWADFAIGELE
jgi:PadR family transcriptional regulator AphA